MSDYKKLKYYKKIIDLECILGFRINKRKYEYINMWLKNIDSDLKECAHNKSYTNEEDE